MERTKRQVGPLTFGTTLGACVGLAIFLFGFYAIQNGTTERSYESLLFMALGGAAAGCVLGFFAESLLLHPRLARKRWVQYVVRPIAFGTVPYLLVALSLRYYGHDKLMSGFGLWFCVVIIPFMGLFVAWHRAPASADRENAR